MTHSLDHPEWHALVAKVAARPDSDTPRMVAADWLQEHDGYMPCPCEWSGYAHGDTCGARCGRTGRIPNGFAEYAEFIRVQVELARSPLDWRTLKRSKGETKESRMARRSELHQREQELFERHKCQWFGGDSWAILYRDGEDYGQYPDLTSAVIRRGFVDEVRLPLATFCGEPCGTCEGSGGIELKMVGIRVKCPGCSGSRRTPGLADDLARRCPTLIRITLTDREPHESVFSNQPPSCRWMWVHNERSPETPSSLPWELYRRLKIKSFRDGGHDWAGYPTRQAALDALSVAALAYAKERAKRGAKSTATP